MLVVRGDTYLKEEIVKIRMAQFYIHKAKERPLREGDLVLRKIEAIENGVIQGKLALNWESLYIVIEKVRPEDISNRNRPRRKDTKDMAF